MFCNIIGGKIPSYKIWENDHFLAILDLFPSTPGMTLVLPKNHYDSYVFDMNDEIYTNFMIAAKTVSKLLDKKLQVLRTAMVMEGTAINHAHIKLYPLHGLSNKNPGIMLEETVFNEEYQGFISTLAGPQYDGNKLDAIHKLFS